MTSPSSSHKRSLTMLFLSLFLLFYVEVKAVLQQTRILQRKAINSNTMCESYTSLIGAGNTTYAASGEAAVSLTKSVSYDDQTMDLSIHMSPGYRPFIYDSLYHFIQISPPDTYDTYEDTKDGDDSELTSTEFNALYNDINTASSTSFTGGDSLCRIQVLPDHTITGNTQNDITITLEDIPLDTVKSCSENTLLTHFRHPGDDSTNTCNYIIHPSTEINLCGTAGSPIASITTLGQCKDQCDIDFSLPCNAFEWDSINSRCTLYPGTDSSKAFDGRFDPEDDTQCSFKSIDTDENKITGLLDPSADANNCFRYNSTLIHSRSNQVRIAQSSDDDCDDFTDVTFSGSTGAKFDDTISGPTHACGSTISESTMNAGSPVADCRNLCAADVTCKAYYYNGGQSSSLRKCKLINKLPTDPDCGGLFTGAPNAYQQLQTFDTTQNDQCYQFNSTAIAGRSNTKFEFVLTSVQCACPSSVNIGNPLFHCDVPFYQKGTYERNVSFDGDAAITNLVLQNQDIYLLPAQNELIQNTTDIQTFELGMGFEFVDASVGIDSTSIAVCDPDNINTAYSDCTSDPFSKPIRRGESIKVSFKARTVAIDADTNPSLQLKSLEVTMWNLEVETRSDITDTSTCSFDTCAISSGTISTSDVPVNEPTAICYEDSTKECVVRKFTVTDDITFKYDTNMNAFSFVLQDADISGMYPKLNGRTGSTNDKQPLIVMMKIELSEAGNRASRRRLGLTSNEIVLGERRRLDVIRDAQITIGIPLIPNENVESTKDVDERSTVLKIHLHNSPTTLIVLSALTFSVLLLISIMWVVRKYRADKRKNDALSKRTHQYDLYGERTPMLYMKGLHMT